MGALKTAWRVIDLIHLLYLITLNQSSCSLKLNNKLLIIFQQFSGVVRFYHLSWCMYMCIYMCACGKIYMFMWVFNCICMCMCSIYFLSLQVGEGFFSPAKGKQKKWLIWSYCRAAKIMLLSCAWLKSGLVKFAWFIKAWVVVSSNFYKSGT